MIPIHVRQMLMSRYAERLAWEAAHPWQARWQRFARPIRNAYREARFRLSVLIFGHECGY